MIQNLKIIITFFVLYLVDVFSSKYIEKNTTIIIYYNIVILLLYIFGQEFC